MVPYLSGDTSLNSALFSAFVCIRNEAIQNQLVSLLPQLESEHNSPVSTNCPTVAEKPERKALNGYFKSKVSTAPSSCHILIQGKGNAYVIPSNNTIHKLQHPNHNQKRHENINQLRPLRRRIQIILPYPQRDLLRALVVRGFLANRRDGAGARAADLCCCCGRGCGLAGGAFGCHFVWICEVVRLNWSCGFVLIFGAVRPRSLMQGVAPSQVDRG
jgi:hypothetical protein